MPGQPNVTLAEVRQPYLQATSTTDFWQSTTEGVQAEPVVPEEPANIESYGPNGAEPDHPQP